MKLLSYLKLAYENLTYQKKLLLSYLALVYIPLIALSLFFYANTTRIISEHVSTLSRLHLEQSADRLSNTFSEMISLAKTISRIDTVRTSLEKEPSVGLIEQAEDLEDMNMSIGNIYHIYDTFSIRLFVDPALSYANRKVLTWSLSDIRQLFPDMEDKIMESPVLLGPSVCQSPLSAPVTVFSVTVPIQGLSDYNKAIAVACVDVTQETLIEIMKMADFSEKGNVYLTDSDGNAILGYSGLTRDVLPDGQLPSFSVPENGSFSQEDGYQYSVSPLIWSTYHLIAVAPIHQLTRDDTLLPLQLIVLGLLLGVIIYLFASFYSRSNAKRIIQLSDTAKEVQKGNLNVHCTVNSLDEIGELQISFNKMIAQMQQMLDSQYRLGCHLKDQELKLLQARIDPHFLYNTLDLIIWTAQNKTSDEVCDIVRKLSSYYRISLSKGADFIPIERELEHVRLYVQLQNKRFQDKIHLNIHIDEASRKLSILKIFLQPLVENSIVHGFQGTDETIAIDIHTDNAVLSITVRDDGAGIEPQKLSRLRLRQQFPQYAAEQDGYGLSNILERIHNFYGEEATMDFTSSSEGTAVVITLPVK